MSLVSTLLQSSSVGDYDTSALESEMTVYESESFINNAFATLMTEIFAVNEAYDTADVISCVKVVTENADPAVLLESMITSGLEKLKATWIKFLAAIKKFFGKVIDYFKSIIYTGKKFTSEFGAKLKNKAKNKTDYKYKGFNYTIAAGDAAVKKVSEAVDKRFKSYISDGLDKAADFTTDELKTKFGLGSDKANTSVSDLQDNVVKDSGVADDQTSLKSEIMKLYRDDKEDKSEQTLGGSSEVAKMIKFVEDCDGAISKFKKEQQSYESKISKVIGKLDVLAKKEGKNKSENKIYQNASTVSTFCTAILNTYKIATNAQIDAYKACNKQYLAVLKAFLRSGFMSESVALEAEDMDDIDMTDDDLTDDVAEAAANGADDPEGGIKDIGIVASEGKKCDGEDLIEEAMRYI